MRNTYGSRLLEHFDRPRHVGEFDRSASEIGSGVAGAAQSGGCLQFQVRVDDGGHIAGCRFKAYGAPALIASGSWLAESVQGMPLDTAETLSFHEIVAALELPPVSLHSAILAHDALKAAIQDYKEKQRTHA